MTKNKLWFRAKFYGWGWFPISWEGWAVVLVFSAIIIFSAILFGKSNQLLMIIETFILAMILIYICIKKGEKPRWRWGK